MKKLMHKISNCFKKADNPVLTTEVFYSDTKHVLDIPLLKELPDEELVRLNNLLPWAAYIVDDRGREFGKAHTTSKRNDPQKIPDYRTLILDDSVQLEGKTVLEVGCFEGIHTVGLVQKGAIVTAFDSRAENLLKTMVRCAAFKVNADVCYWNLEKDKPENIGQYDIVHHIGVLYHLLNPIEHLKEICECAKTTLLLDTHVALTEALSTKTFEGFKYRYFEYGEGGRESPFSGMEMTAKWIYRDDLVSYLERLGFSNVQLLEERNERNGARVLILATR